MKNDLSKDTFAMILGGGRGRKLFPLTLHRAKPAISLGGKYRLIDIPISNCINSGINRVFVLTQFLSSSLNRHITQTYQFDNFSNGHVEILADEQSPTDFTYSQGSADAVRKNLRYIKEIDAKYVFIINGDILFKMDMNKMLKYHIKKKANITIATSKVKIKEVEKFGIIKKDKKNKIIEYHQKPNDPEIVHNLRNDKDNSFHASMGLYVFNKDILIDLVEKTAYKDFGYKILPEALKKYDVYSYKNKEYLKDISTLNSYFEINLSLTGQESPFSFYNEENPVYTHPRFLPAPKIIESKINNSIISDGSLINSSNINNSLLGIRTLIDKNCKINETIVIGNDNYPKNYEDISKFKYKNGNMNIGIGKNTKIKRAIIDKNVKIGKNCIIKGIDKEYINIRNGEKAKFQIVNGIVIIPKNTVIEDDTVIKAEDYLS